MWVSAMSLLLQWTVCSKLVY